LGWQQQLDRRERGKGRGEAPSRIFQRVSSRGWSLVRSTVPPHLNDTSKWILILNDQKELPRGLNCEEKTLATVWLKSL
jgi:hypothetical protein